MPATFVGAVTPEALEAVYAVTYRAALHHAAQIVGAAHAEDVVQNAFVGLLRRRDYLRGATSGLFIKRVVWEALVLKRPGWLVFVDPLELEGLEHQQWRVEHGGRAEAR